MMARVLRWLVGTAFVLTLASGLGLAMPAFAEEGAASEGPRLLHNVYFKLQEANDENRAEFTKIAYDTLPQIPGVVHFVVGQMAPDTEKIADKQFDMALHVVFKDKAAADGYLVHPKHTEFVERGKKLWSGVRVFDTRVIKKEE